MSLPAVIVTFHPDAGWPSRLAAIRGEHARVIVVDNSTSTEAREQVARAVVGVPGATLLSLPDNPGLGSALNLGFSTLAAEGHVRAVAFDQDSTPAAGFAAALAATADAHPQAAVVGANWTDPRRPGRPSLFLCSNMPFWLGFRRVMAARDLAGLVCVITSGSLFDLLTWRKLGGFDEQLFLDLVDTDYCLRTRRAGHDIAVSSTARLLHHRGEKAPVRFLGREFYPAHTPPFRLYCLARNRILLFRRHRLRPVAWTLYEITYALKLAADALFLETNTWNRLMATAHGSWDGLQGKMGPVRHDPEPAIETGRQNASGKPL